MLTVNRDIAEEAQSTFSTDTVRHTKNGRRRSKHLQPETTVQRESRLERIDEVMSSNLKQDDLPLR